MDLIPGKSKTFGHKIPRRKLKAGEKSKEDKKKKPSCEKEGLRGSGGDLLSQGNPVSSAQSGLTAVFGKGTGVTPTIRPPEEEKKRRSVEEIRKRE